MEELQGSADAGIVQTPAAPAHAVPSRSWPERHLPLPRGAGKADRRGLSPCPIHLGPQKGSVLLTEGHQGQDVQGEEGQPPNPNDYLNKTPCSFLGFPSYQSS